MSLLTMVEEAIKLCKAEQTKINENIQVYREMLLSLRLHNNDDSKESELAADADKDPDILPEEKEDMELLERALEKALRIRSGTEPHGFNGPSGPNKEPDGAVTKPKGGTQAPGTSTGNQATVRATLKSTSLDRKGSKYPTISGPSMGGAKGMTGHPHRQSKASVHRNSVQKRPVLSAKALPRQSASKVKQTLSCSDHANRGQSYASITHSKYEAIQSSLRSGGDSGKAAATSLTPRKDPVSVAHAGRTGTHCLPPQNCRMPSEQMAKWKSLQSKQNRLWDKVMATQREPVSERNHFMERMRATFPKDWPCGSPDRTRALMDKLTHQGEELTHYYQTQLLLARQASANGTEPGSKEKEHKSHQILEDLAVTAEELRKRAGHVKQEWEAWDRWRPEGGCLCPIGVKGEWGDEASSPLPPTVTYTTEAELREVERLRLRVALLQQETHLQKAVSDTLSPQLSSMLRGPGRPNPSVYRDMYSLLAEGGEQFPALVLDTEPD